MPTSFSSSRASVSSGSSHSPVWTGEVWITVLDGATSQWKRSDCSSCATGPESGVARRRSASIASRCARTSATSSSGANAASRASSSAIRAAR